MVRSGRPVTAADPHPIHRIPARPSREGRRYSPISPGQPTVLARALTEPVERLAWAAAHTGPQPYRAIAADA